MGIKLFFTDLGAEHNTKGIDEETGNGTQLYLYSDINDMLNSYATRETEESVPILSIKQPLIYNGLLVKMFLIKNVEELLEKGYIEEETKGLYKIKKRITGRFLEPYYLSIEDVGNLNGKVVYKYNVSKPNEQVKNYHKEIENRLYNEETFLYNIMESMVRKTKERFVLEYAYYAYNNPEFIVGVISAYHNGGALLCVANRRTGIQRYKFIKNIEIENEREFDFEIEGVKLVCKTDRQYSVPEEVYKNMG